MKIVSFVPMESPNKPNTKPFIRVGDGHGCGSEGCHCSDGHWISVSDGKTGLVAMFDSAEEMESYLYPHKF